jgi:hypothetical protein
MALVLPAIDGFSIGSGWEYSSKKLWVRLLKIYDDIRGIDWKWQSLDSVTIKTPLVERIRQAPTRPIEAS